MAWINMNTSGLGLNGVYLSVLDLSGLDFRESGTL